MRLLRTLAAAALLFVLAGCMTLDGDLTIEDDTVSGAFLVTVERAALVEAGVSDEEFFARLETWNPVQRLPARRQALVETYVSSGQVGKRYVYDRVPLADFNAGQTWQIQHKGGEYLVTGQLDLSGFAGAPGVDTAEAARGWDVTVRMTFPGEIRSANGRLEGRRTVVWRPAFGQATTLSAAAADGSSPFALSRFGVDSDSLVGPGRWVVGTAVAVEVTVVVGSALLFWRRRRRRAAPAFAAARAASPGLAARSLPAASTRSTARTWSSTPSPVPGQPASASGSSSSGSPASWRASPAPRGGGGRHRAR